VARRLDKKQLEEFKGFLIGLRSLGGYATDAEWARESGVHAVNLSNARTGSAQLDGYNLLRLIVAVARRTKSAPEDTAVQAAVVRAGAQAGRAAASVVSVADLEAIAGGLEQLSQRVSELTQRQRGAS
jgi:hypothetical protein